MKTVFSCNFLFGNNRFYHGFLLSLRPNYNQFQLLDVDVKEEDFFFDVLYGAYNRARIYDQNENPNIVIRSYKDAESWQR